MSSYNDRFSFTYQQIQAEFDTFHDTFKHYGVAVITDVFSKKECDAHADSILTAFERLGTGVRRDNVDSWMTKPQNLVPTQTRVGLYKQVFSNLPAVWDIRSDDRLISLFTRLYNGDHRLIVSGDGINVLVNGRSEKLSPNKDWAHLDSVGPFDGCIQGQVVLTDTSAAFRCSPRSNAIYDDFMTCVLNKTKATNNNWHKLNGAQIEWYKMHLPKDGQYQIRIPAPRGSVILWYSHVVHSACPALETVKHPPADNPFLGTRCVVYVSYQTVAMYERRPPMITRTATGSNKRKTNVYSNNDHIEARAGVVKANVSTNHRGMPMPYKRGRFPPPPCHPIIDSIQRNPAQLYEILGFSPKPLWDDKSARLAGVKPYSEGEKARRKSEVKALRRTTEVTNKNNNEESK
ncbi:hypothetical protein ACA910_018039 [Epithemia clementina (nom. ined.)]